MKQYNHAKIERKWQKKWQDTKLYQVDIKNARKPFYNLMMFPYPSAEGLHVGSVFTFCGIDAYGRFKRMQGNDVFEPIGLDAFGIHSENHALKTNTHPIDHAKQTEENFYRQLHQTGNSYDWSKTVETNKSNYYKWTQWIFLQLYKQGLAERKSAPVNWCPSCLTVLSDEQVIAGRCERCGTEVTIKELEQWFFKITKYSDRLLANLEWIDWDKSVKAMQKNWIGKKVGAEIEFGIKGRKEKITIFTTRPDTIYGVTAIVLGPEYKIAKNILKGQYRDKGLRYIMESEKISHFSRLLNSHMKTGVKTGSYAINPINGEQVPIFIADYVIGSYGTGAIMLVPAHDQRDFEFAKIFNIDIKLVVKENSINMENRDHDSSKSSISDLAQVYEDSGILIDSGEYSGLTCEKASEKIIAYLSEQGFARVAATYHLRDWLISRQRYWGPPIPIIYCDKCGIQPVPESDLPVLLPYIDDFRPTGSGKSPLALHPDFYNAKCPKCLQAAKRETDVSDTFLDSSWYFLRYPSADSLDVPFDKSITQKWLPVNSYIGGKEHTVLHLLYSRFITMVLHDAGFLNFEEPFAQFRINGLITKDGAKMSKSKGNVKNPDEYIEKYGIDTLRCYFAFLGPFSVGGDFHDSGVAGMRRFMVRIWHFVNQAEQVSQATEEEKVIVAKTISKISKDIDELHFNTAIASIMEFYNFLSKQSTVSVQSVKTLLLLLAPFAPHMSEELWQIIGGQYSIHKSQWPSYDPQYLKEKQATIIIQINGRTRDKIVSAVDTTEADIIQQVLIRDRIRTILADRPIKKTIYIKNRLINLVS